MVIKTGHNWSFLQHLSLDGVFADHQNLLSLLSTHASTLRSLELSNNILSDAYQSTRNMSSWIKTFIFLNERMSLRIFNFSQHLRVVPSGEHWYVTCSCRDSPRHIDCLPERIIQYVTHQGACLFKPLAAAGETAVGETPNSANKYFDDAWEIVLGDCFREG